MVSRRPKPVAVVTVLKDQIGLSELGIDGVQDRVSFAVEYLKSFAFPVLEAEVHSLCLL